MTLERDRTKDRARETQARVAETTPTGPQQAGAEPAIDLASPADAKQPATAAEPDLADPAAIRADILATRSALGLTVEELADRVNPIARGRRAAVRLRAAGGAAVGDLNHRNGWLLLAAAAVAGAGIAGGIALALTRRSRS